MNLTKYERRPSREVRIGRVVIGGNRPIAVQSMTNTDTKDTEACIRQIERIFRAGGPIVRLTAQGRREGENLERIVRRLREEGCGAAVVADIHFVPEVAAIAAKYVDKVRTIPGNYNSSHGEFEALIDRCRERGVAIRIGPGGPETLPSRLQNFDAVWAELQRRGERPAVVFLDNRAHVDHVTVRLEPASRAGSGTPQ